MPLYELGKELVALSNRYARPPSMFEIIESSPEGFKDGTVYASIRDTRYRPIMIDAIPMSSDKRTETFSYLYIPTLSEMN
jgi:hypothetical protein